MSTSSIISSKELLSLSGFKEEGKEQPDDITLVAISSIQEYVISINWLCDCYLLKIQKRIILIDKFNRDAVVEFAKFIEKNIELLRSSDDNGFLDFLEKRDESQAKILNNIIEDCINDQENGLEISRHAENILKSKSIGLDVLYIADNEAKEILSQRKITFERLKNPEFCHFIAQQCLLDASEFLILSKQMSIQYWEHRFRFMASEFFRDLLFLVKDEGIGALFLFKERKVKLLVEALDELNFPKSVAFNLIVPYITWN